MNIEYDCMCLAGTAVCWHEHVLCSEHECRALQINILLRVILFLHSVNARCLIDSFINEMNGFFVWAGNG